MIIFQHLSPNAGLIPSALFTLHVYKKNVKIRVKQALVELMLSVKPKIIEQYALAFMDL